MKEVFTQWKYTKMVVLTALTAAVYAAVMIPFKIATIVPGFTEIRPAVAIPIVFGLFFGPAGAWGAAMGNMIGDVFGGMLTIISLFGFIGNFFLGFIGYKLREKWELLTVDERMDIRSLKGYMQFFFIVLVSAAACATIISWGMDAFRIFPFAVFVSIVFLNNLIMPAVIGPFLFWLLNPRLERWDLIWTDIIDKKDRSVSRIPTVGGALICIGAVGGLVVGFLLSIGVYSFDILGNVAPGSYEGLGNPAIIITGAVSLLLMIVGALL
ncbi:MAG: QueT transporter family protein [Deltaproteobacteria bacterium]|nr:QueT transporter family protein [Candidatus Zymogenaceae bacterium]